MRGGLEDEGKGGGRFDSGMNDKRQPTGGEHGWSRLRLIGSAKVAGGGKRGRVGVAKLAKGEKR